MALLQRFSGVVFVVPLLLSLCAPAQAQFETRGISAAPLFPSSVAVGDFNRDGKLDLAVASVDSLNNGQQGYSTNVQVLLGNGDGTFQKAIDYPVGTGPKSVATADLNGDGNLDLVVTSGPADNLSVLLGRGDGTFLPTVYYATPQDPILVMVGDFNHDGKPDIATLNQSDETGYCDCVAVFLGNGDGTFRPTPVLTSASLTPLAMGVGEFDSGDNLDVALGEQFGAASQVEILLGNGDGTFTRADVYPVCCNISSVAVGDFNGDHRSDLATAENEGVGIGVLLGNGDGSFQPVVEYPTNFPYWVTSANLNQNGRQDLVVANLDFPSGVSVFPGNGDGTFKAARYYADGSEDRFVTVGDFNGDHKLDIVVPDSGDSNVIVMLNTRVVTFSPTTPLSFGKQKHGTTSKPLMVKLTDSGTSDLKITSMRVSGEFGMKSNCGSSVPAGKSCTLSVTFSPQSQGAKSGIVTINDSASSKPMVIELSGTGT